MTQQVQPKTRRFGYQQVADAIRARIAAGEWSEGEQLPNLEDMIDRFGYSRMTVFKGLQQLESQGVITMSRGRGTFVRRQVARPAVGFVTRHLLDAPGNGFPTLIARELEDRVHARGWNMRLYSDARGAGYGTPPWELLEALERGAIIGLATVNSDLPRVFMRSQEWENLAIPHVGLGAQEHIKHGIVWDRDSIATLIANYCQDNGLQTIGTIGSHGSSCRSDLSAAGIACLDGWTVGVPSGMGMEEGGYMLIRQLWQRGQRPQALFVSDDVVAKGVVQGLLSVGAEIPKDMVVIATINSGTPQFYPLPLVKVVFDTGVIAEQMLAVLDLLLETPEAGALERVITPYLDTTDLVRFA